MFTFAAPANANIRSFTSAAAASPAATQPDAGDFGKGIPNDNKCPLSCHPLRLIGPSEGRCWGGEGK